MSSIVVFEAEAGMYAVSNVEQHIVVILEIRHGLPRPSPHR